MDDFVNLTCPCCGGALHIADDLERFACRYCGTEHLVRRVGGTVSLQIIKQELSGILQSMDSAVAELAIQRLTREIDSLRNAQAQLSYEIDLVSGLMWWGKLFAFGLASVILIWSIASASTQGVSGFLDGFVLVAFLIGLGFLLQKASNSRDQESSKMWDRYQDEIDRKTDQLEEYEEAVEW